MWRVELTKRARKQLLKLPKNAQRNIARALRQKLSVNPDLYLSRLSGYKENLYKFRVNDYRVLCTKHDEELVVIAVAVGHRKDVYRTTLLN